MVQTGSYIAFFSYVTISVIVGLTLVGVGYWIVK
jgi:fluoride ion exporter CrcB/FEX